MHKNYPNSLLNRDGEGRTTLIASLNPFNPCTYFLIVLVIPVLKKSIVDLCQWWGTYDPTEAAGPPTIIIPDWALKSSNI